MQHSCACCIDTFSKAAQAEQRIFTYRPITMLPQGFFAVWGSSIKPSWPLSKMHTIAVLMEEDSVQQALLIVNVGMQWQHTHQFAYCPGQHYIELMAGWHCKLHTCQSCSSSRFQGALNCQASSRSMLYHALRQASDFAESSS